MNMIYCAADGFGDSIRRANQTAEIFMQTRSPLIRDERMPVFRAEYNVEVQAYMRGWHGNYVAKRRRKLARHEVSGQDAQRDSS
jgi:hypothetical protein